MLFVPGLDEPAAGVHHMFHLEVRGCVHGNQNEAVLQGQGGGVHEVQQDGKTIRVNFRVQADGTQVTLQGVREYGVKKSTIKIKKML